MPGFPDAPFPSRPHFPLRWTVIDDPSGDVHFIVLAYHHVVGDAFCAQALLADVVRTYLGQPEKGRRNGLHVTAGHQANGRAHRPQC